MGHLEPLRCRAALVRTHQTHVNMEMPPREKLGCLGEFSAGGSAAAPQGCSWEPVVAWGPASHADACNPCGSSGAPSPPSARTVGTSPGTCDRDPQALPEEWLWPQQNSCRGLGGARGRGSCSGHCCEGRPVLDTLGTGQGTKQVKSCAHGLRKLNEMQGVWVAKEEKQSKKG